MNKRDVAKVSVAGPHVYQKALECNDSADIRAQFTSWSFGENMRRWGCSARSAPSAVTSLTPLSLPR